MFSHKRLAMSSALTVLGLSAGAAQAAVSYFDGVFNNADWGLVVLTNATGTGSTASGTQVPTGGNPNEFRRVQHTLNVTGSPFNGAVFSFHINTNATYNPAISGAITSIDYSEDDINFIPETVVPGNGQGSGLLIVQGGRYYRQQSPLFIMPHSQFANWASNAAPGLIASDFAEVSLTGIINAGSNPDFSAGGGIITFGFHRGNSGNGGYSTDTGIDNWSVRVIPAPSAAAILGLAGVATLGRRRRN